MQELISLKNVSKLYDARSIEGVREFNLTLKPTQLVGLLGPSGAGKSTVAKIISGELKIDAGTVELNEAKPLLIDASFWNQYSINEQTVFSFLLENLKKDLIDINEENIINQFRTTLTHLNLETQLEKKITNLSSGEKERVKLALILNLPFNTYLLDEPFVHLDFALQKELFSFFKDSLIESEKAALAISHHAYLLLNTCDEVSFLSSGKQTNLDLTQTEVHKLAPNHEFYQFLELPPPIALEVKLFDKSLVTMIGETPIKIENYRSQLSPKITEITESNYFLTYLDPRQMQVSASEPGIPVTLKSTYYAGTQTMAIYQSELHEFTITTDDIIEKGNLIINPKALYFMESLT